MVNDTYVIRTICGRMYVHVIYDGLGNIQHIITNLGKSGTCVRVQLSSYTSLINAMLKFMTKEQCIVAINSSTGHRCQGQQTETCVDLLGRLLVDVLLNDDPDLQEEDD